MPTITPAGERVVQPQALPGVRQNINPGPAAFGAAQGRAMQQVGGALQQVGAAAADIAEHIDREDTRRAREAWAELQADVSVVTDEAKARRGVDVAPKGKPSVSQDYRDKLLQAYGKRTQGLSAGARAKLETMWQPYARVHAAQIASHEREQLDAVDVQNAEVSVGNAMRDWAADPTNADAVDNAKMRIGAEVAHIGRIKGQSLEVMQERHRAELTKGHVNAVSALLAADRAGDAQAYYAKYKDEVDARVREDVENKLKLHAEVTKSQEAADQLFAKHGGDLTKALDEVRKSYSGTLEEKIVSQLKVRAGEADHAKEKRAHASYNAALDKILTATSADEALTAAMKADVEPELRLRLVNVVNGMQRAERGEAGNPAGFVELAELIDQGTITDAKTVQAAAAERGLSKKEIADAVKYAQQGGLAGEVKVSEVTRLAKAWKKNITPAEIGLLTQYVIGDLKKQAPGKAVTPEELEQRVAGYLWKGETTARVKPDGSVERPGWFTFGAGWNETGLQARRSGNIESWIPDVNSDEEVDLRVELADLTGLSPDAFDLDTLRVFKKQKAGLPLGTAQQTKVPKKQAKPAAPPEAGPSARQRSAAERAAAILDNSGQN